MNTNQRMNNYHDQSGVTTGIRLTAAQRRRLTQKSRRTESGKTHEHMAGERCYICRPARRPAVATTPSRIRAVTA